jgi:hypothetical protein
VDPVLIPGEPTAEPSTTGLQPSAEPSTTGLKPDAPGVNVPTAQPSAGSSEPHVDTNYPSAGTTAEPSHGSVTPVTDSVPSAEPSALPDSGGGQEGGEDGGPEVEPTVTPSAASVMPTDVSGGGEGDNPDPADPSKQGDDMLEGDHPSPPGPSASLVLFLLLIACLACLYCFVWCKHGCTTQGLTLSAAWSIIRKALSNQFPGVFGGGGSDRGSYAYEQV